MRQVWEIVARYTCLAVISCHITKKHIYHLVQTKGRPSSLTEWQLPPRSGATLDSKDPMDAVTQSKQLESEPWFIPPNHTWYSLGFQGHQDLTHSIRKIHSLGIAAIEFEAERRVIDTMDLFTREKWLRFMKSDMVVRVQCQRRCRGCHYCGVRRGPCQTIIQSRI